MNEIVHIFGIDWKLLLVQSINFGLVLLVLWYFLYRPVIAMIDARRKKIEEGVENAEAAQVRLEEIEGERDTVLDKATHKARDILQTSKQRAEEQAGEVVEDAHQRAEGIVQDATLRAQEAKERAMRESKDEIAQAAILAAEKILKEK